MKRFLLFLVLLIFSHVSIGVKITCAEDLIKIFDTATGSSVDDDIELVSDLDFSNANLTIPLGVNPNGICVTYNGVFHGNGHSIYGLIINNSKRYEHSGLFCGLENATIENIRFDSSCSFSANKNAGALGAWAKGSLHLKNVINNASINGGCCGVGGLIGQMEVRNDRDAVFSLEGCINEGNITGANSNAGGFVGIIMNRQNLSVIISNSINNGYVHGEYNVGGFVGMIDSYETAISVLINNCINSGVINGSWNIGGFVGQMNEAEHSTVTVSNCKNTGIINGDDCVGGFFGVFFIGIDTSVRMRNNVNNGDIISGETVGGFIGRFVNHGKLIIENCSNYGFIKVFYSQASVGGIIGSMEGQNDPFPSRLILSSISNNHNIIANCDCCSVGGLIGTIFEMLFVDVFINDVTTNGLMIVNASGTNPSIGGFIGLTTEDSNLTLRIYNSINHFNISSHHVKQAGGFIGSITNNINIIKEPKISLVNCSNMGMINCNGTSFVGGLVGYLFSVESVFIDGCENNGIINTTENNPNIGGLIGFYSNEMNVIVNPVLTISNSVNKGTLTLSNNQVGIVGGIIGTVYKSIDVVLNIINCTNDIDLITSENCKECNLGGIIGSLKDNGRVKMDLKNCSNKAGILSNGENNNIGGFIGLVNENVKSMVDIVGFVNNGSLYISGTQNDVGGIVGSVLNNPVMEMKISSGINFGYMNVIEGDELHNIGGIIGKIEQNPSMDIEIVDITNYGNVSSCQKCTCNNGGLIGIINPKTKKNWV